MEMYTSRYKKIGAETKQSRFSKRANKTINYRIALFKCIPTWQCAVFIWVKIVKNKSRTCSISSSSYSYSIGGPEPCLVYQYMSGGCLDMRLRVKDDTKVLKWETRLNIAIGTARCVYLNRN